MQGAWFLLLLFSRTCTTSMVRRVGCMVETGRSPPSMQREEENLSDMDYKPLEDRSLDTGLLGENGVPGSSAPAAATFFVVFDDPESMTIQVCVRRCWELRYSFAALQDGRRCLCGGKKDRLVPVDIGMCHERCTGNCKQRCGGRVAFSVYSTGYEMGPALPPVDLNAGLLGCFPEGRVREWCDAPETGQGKDKMVELSGVGSRTSGGIVQRRKDPLVSPQMSPLLCVTYCASAPHSRPVATLLDSDKCCCGSSLSSISVGRRQELNVDFNQYCNKPCAVPTTGPRCYGIFGPNRFISVYDTFAIWPEPSMRPGISINNASWIKPIFPPDENLEVSMKKAEEPERWPTRLSLMGDDKEEASLELLVPIQNSDWTPAPPPMEDQANQRPYVKVYDDLDTFTGEGKMPRTWLWVSLVVLLLCTMAVFVVCIVYYIMRKKKKSDGKDDMGDNISKSANNSSSNDVEKGSPPRKVTDICPKWTWTCHNKSSSNKSSSSRSNRGQKDKNRNNQDSSDSEGVGSEMDSLLG